ncbi:MAG: ATP-binding protein [Candidatus Dormibacteria bacterium]
MALQGPRAVGRSTLLQQLARELGAEIVDLDDPALREIAHADPGTLVAGPAPVCVDEYQHVPGIRDAIKSELNRDLRPGRLVLAGSTRYGAVPLAAQALTGRLHLLPIWPLSQGELAGVRENLLEVALSNPEATVTGGSSPTTRHQYVQLVTGGGFPLALARSAGAGRNRWFDDHVILVLERDVRELARIRQREQRPLLSRRVAAQTAPVLNVNAAASVRGRDRTVASDYLRVANAAGSRVSDPSTARLGNDPASPGRRFPQDSPGRLGTGGSTAKEVLPTAMGHRPPEPLVVRPHGLDAPLGGRDFEHESRACQRGATTRDEPTRAAGFTLDTGTSVGHRSGTRVNHHNSAPTSAGCPTFRTDPRQTPGTHRSVSGVWPGLALVTHTRLAPGSIAYQTRPAPVTSNWPLLQRLAPDQSRAEVPRRAMLAAGIRWRLRP